MAEASTSAMEVDTTSEILKQRNEQILLLMKVVQILYQEFYPELTFAKGHIIDIDRSDLIAGALATVYTFLRKQENVQQASAASIYGAYEININGKTKSVSSLGKLIHTAGIKLDFKIATPLMNMLAAFKLSFDEVRLGMTKVTNRRRPGETKNSTENITAYGLSNIHIPLLHGITFQPERRTALLEGLGPIALAILLLNEKKYPGKLEKALNTSLKMLPMAEQIIQCLKNTSKENTRSLLRELGDLLLVTSHRSTRRIFFILESFFLTVSPQNINGINFNGTNGIIFYNTLMTQFRYQMKSNGDIDMVKQAVFHSMFGTNIEDFGVLAKITDCTKWLKRREIDNTFTKRSTAKPKVFSLINFIYISKMLKANPTKLLGTVAPMLVNGMVFAGNRKRNFSTAFNEYLTSGKQSVSYGTDANSLSFALRTMRTEILKDNKGDKLITAGTTSWLKWNHETRTAESCDFTVEESGEYFYE